MLECRRHRSQVNPGRGRPQEEGLQRKANHQRRIMEESVLVSNLQRSHQQRGCRQSASYQRRRVRLQRASLPRHPIDTLQVMT